MMTMSVRSFRSLGCMGYFRPMRRLLGFDTMNLCGLCHIFHFDRFGRLGSMGYLLSFRGLMGSNHIGGSRHVRRSISKRGASYEEQRYR